MISVIDQTGQSIDIEQSPRRIISIVPSQTELLYYLRKPPIAQTIFCVHPQKQFNDSIKVGGTKKLNINKIIELQPDLIIGNKEENDKEQIEYLRRFFPVWLSDIYTLEDNYAMIQSIGKLTNSPKKSEELCKDIKQAFAAFTKNEQPKVLYLIWNKPYMVAGTDTFIHEMINAAGFSNCITEPSRYPELTIDDIKNVNPEYVFLSSEPFPFKEKHRTEIQKLLPDQKVVLVDGEMFSWYGNRILQAADYFKQLKLQLTK